MKRLYSSVGKSIVLFKRFVLFAPTILLFVISFYLFFPRLNRRLPASLAVVIIYVTTAYVTLPLLFRLWRLIRPSDHLPRYCVTPDGLASDPVNIAISASRSKLIAAMQQAGWHKADSRSSRSLVRLGLSILLHRPYPNAPFSTLYLFGRGHDIGFQKPTLGSKGSHRRHHVRFWACIPAMLEGKDTEHADFWERLYPETDKGEILWVGCASRDIGIVPIVHNLQLTHRVLDDTDTERDIIVSDLQATGLVETIRHVQSGEPLKLRNRALASSLSTDGQLSIVDLK
jgi:hypothetical protein